PGLRKKAIAGKHNGQLIDLRTPIDADGPIEIITSGSEEALEIMRHSTAHLIAQAVKRLYPAVKLGVGPVIEHGFYYDMDLDHAITPEDIRIIEKEMKQIIIENIEITRKEVTRNEAKAFFANDQYKRELIDAIPADE